MIIEIDRPKFDAFCQKSQLEHINQGYIVHMVKHKQTDLVVLGIETNRFGNTSCKAIKAVYSDKYNSKPKPMSINTYKGMVLNGRLEPNYQGLKLVYKQTSVVLTGTIYTFVPVLTGTQVEFKF